MSQKGLSSLVIILLMVILTMVGGAYYFGKSSFRPADSKSQITSLTTQSIPTSNVTLTDKIANWKTYTNSKYNFELKYPNTWYVKSCNSEDLLLLDPTENPACGGGPLGYTNPIVISVYSPNKTIKDFTNILEADGLKLTPQTTKLLPNNGQKFITEKTKPAPGVDKSILILIPLEKSILEITVNDFNQEYTVDQIVSTFKFINSSIKPDVMVSKAKEDLASLLRISPESIQIIKSEHVVWSDTCLGGPKQSNCGVKADVPGYKVIFKALGKNYEYHTGGEYYRKITE